MNSLLASEDMVVRECVSIGGVGRERARRKEEGGRRRGEEERRGDRAIDQ